MCTITSAINLHPNMNSLNPTAPKNKDFIDPTKFLHHMAIDHQSITQTPCGQFLESTQDKIAEDMRVNNLFQFLGRGSSLSNYRKLSA